MQIFIKSLSGKTFTLDVHVNETVISLKRKIKDKDGIPVNLQRLLFGTKCLNDTKLLSDYSVQKESTVRILLNSVHFVKKNVHPLTITNYVSLFNDNDLNRANDTILCLLEDGWHIDRLYRYTFILGDIRRSIERQYNYTGLYPFKRIQISSDTYIVMYNLNI